MNGNDLFQLILLPKGDVNRPNGICVYCPFTNVLAEGATYEEAVNIWRLRAQKKLGSYLTIPKQTELMCRKVWYGVEQQSKEPLFLIDFANGVAGKASVVLPSSLTVKQTYNESELGALCDWSVPCSKILHISQHLDTFRHWNSLTPNVIN